MNHIRISGEIIQKYEQIIELSDEDLQKFRNDLKRKGEPGSQAVDDFLGENYGNNDPLDWQYDYWSAQLIDGDGMMIEEIV